MVLKIDTKELAEACDRLMEARFPASTFNDASNRRRNNMSAVQSHTERKYMLFQLNNASIEINRGFTKLTYKTKGLLGSREQPVVSEVKIIFSSAAAVSKYDLEHVGTNGILLVVMDNDVPKFDKLLCEDTNKKVIDLSNFITVNDIGVYDFTMMF